MTQRSTGNADLAWCYDAVTDVSRTFAITIAELDEPMARDICVGYLVCRVADTIEDDPHIPPSEKARLLRIYDDVLDPTSDADAGQFESAVSEWVPSDPGADWRVVASAPRVLGTFRALDADTRDRIRPPVRELVSGMAEFVERYADEGGLRIETVDELEEYCWYAAGTVGDLVTNLVAQEASTAVTDRLEEHARDFGLLLQLVNVAKDVGTDYAEENNVYLPEAWLDDAGVSPSDIDDPAAVDRLASVVERVTAHAEGYLDGTQAWLEAMPEHRGNTLSAWAIPFLLAVGTIRELKARPEDPIREGNVKISRAEVHAVMAQFGQGVTADDLDTLRNRIEQRPLHEW
ncbi:MULTISPECIES: phytoene/squalene synthase family protein [Salinibaculum]|uniref:phytoene/squalene synthase family protein n=1 Tax=Salinibaculum TaxID=2732368 RepID=UPI0030D078B0